MISNINDYLSTTPESKWQDCTAGGECSQCGECCGNFLPVTAKEIQRIKAYIKKRGIKEQKKVYPLASVVMDLTCPFLDAEKTAGKCRIYPVRPQICRAYRCDKAPHEVMQGLDISEQYDPVSMRDVFCGQGARK